MGMDEKDLVDDKFDKILHMFKTLVFALIRSNLIKRVAIATSISVLRCVEIQNQSV